MFLVCLLFIIGFVHAELYYVFDVEYDNGDIKLENVEVEFSNLELENILNDFYFDTYRVDLIGLNNEVLDEVEFGILNKEFYDTENSSGDMIDGGFVERDKVDFEVFAHYYENVNRIIFYDESGEEKGREDVSYLSKEKIVGGDEIKDEKDVVNIRDIEAEDGKNLIYWLIGIILLIILIYFVLRKRKKI